MNEQDAKPNRPPTEPQPDPKTLAQSPAEAYWKEIIEAVPRGAADTRRGRVQEPRHTPPADPVVTPDSIRIKEPDAARRSSVSAETIATTTRASVTNLWKALIESQPAMPANGFRRARSPKQHSGN